MSRLLPVAAALVCLITAVPLPAQPPPREMAVTIDDLPTVSAVRQAPEFAERLTADPGEPAVPDWINAAAESR